MASGLIVAGPATPGVAGSVGAPSYRVCHTARFVVACSRQFAPFFGVTPGDLGQAMSLFGRLLNPLGGLAHLLGQRAGSCQNVVKAGFGRRSSPGHPNLYRSLLKKQTSRGVPLFLALARVARRHVTRLAPGTEAPNIRLRR